MGKSKEDKEMSEEYEDELVTSHSDENPELSSTERRGPIAAHSLEGSAVSELYKQDDMERRLRYLPKAGETVTYEEIYIPSEE
jgi:hypothetical protein